MNFERGKDVKESLSVGILRTAPHISELTLIGKIQPFPESEDQKYALIDIHESIRGIEFYKLMLSIKRYGIDNLKILEMFQQKLSEAFESSYGKIMDKKILKINIIFYKDIRSPGVHPFGWDRIELEDIIGKYVIIGKDNIIPIKKMNHEL